MTPIPTRALPALLLALLAAAGAARAGGPAPDAALEPLPFTDPELGLTMRLPRGTLVTIESVQAEAAYTFTEGGDDVGWTMRLRHVTSRLAAPTPALLVDEHLRRQGEVGRAYRVLSNGPVEYGGVEGHLCFLRQEAPGGQALVNGWLVLRTGQQTFLVLSIVTRAERFAEFRLVAEASFQTIELRPQEAIAGERQARLERGRAFLRSLGASRLRGLVGRDVWLRAYRPADAQSGEPRELACSRVRVLESPRGALNPERDPATYGPGEDEPGLLVEVQGRMPVDARRGIYFDWLAMYWMAWDQSEEAWSVRGTSRRGETTRSRAETGVRTAPSVGAGLGDPRPTLTVIEADAADRTRTPHEWTVPEVYLSQALGWCLGELLPRDGGELELAYYFYSNVSGTSPELAQRVDHWAPAGDGSGRWILRTTLTPLSGTFETVYDRQGRLVRRVREDGSVTEPIELAELRQLWAERGLLLERPGATPPRARPRGDRGGRIGR